MWSLCRCWAVFCVRYFMMVILLSFAHWAGNGHPRSCIGMSVLTKMPNYVRPFAYKQLAWISFFHGAPTFRCSLLRDAGGRFARCRIIRIGGCTEGTFSPDPESGIVLS